MLSPPLLWLIAGVLLCLLELGFPSAYVEFMLGLSALVVAALALVIPQFSLQVVLWLLLSAIAIVLSRRFLSTKPSRIEHGDALEGETLTAIAPGETGRILYEGNSWPARCADESLAIEPHSRVYVVDREGNMLIVLPRNLLKS